MPNQFLPYTVLDANGHRLGEARTKKDAQAIADANEGATVIDTPELEVAE